MGKISSKKAQKWTLDKWGHDLASAMWAGKGGKVRSGLKTSMGSRILNNAKRANGNRSIDTETDATKLLRLLNGLEMLGMQGRLRYAPDVGNIDHILAECNAPVIYVDCIRLSRLLKSLAEDAGITAANLTSMEIDDVHGADAQYRFVTKPLGTNHPGIYGRFTSVDGNMSPNVRDNGHWNRVTFLNHTVMGAQAVPGAKNYYDPTMRAAYDNLHDMVDFWFVKHDDNTFRLDVTRAGTANGRGPNCTVHNFRNNPILADDVRLVRSDAQPDRLGPGMTAWNLVVKA